MNYDIRDVNIIHLKSFKLKAVCRFIIENSSKQGSMIWNIGAFLFNDGEMMKFIWV